MNVNKSIATIAIASVGIVGLLSYSIAEQAVKVDFSDETVGAEPKSLAASCGDQQLAAAPATADTIKPSRAACSGSGFVA
jgi:hypothetical protein